MPGSCPAVLLADLVPRLKAAKDRGCQPAEEAAPYQHRYAAADELKELVQAAQQLTAANSSTAAAEFAAWCQLERGLQLLETDLLAEGQKALAEGLSYAWPSTVECLAIQLQAHNALAGLWCERSEHDTALTHLQSAAELYDRITQQQQQQPGQRDAAAGAAAVEPSPAAAAAGTSPGDHSSSSSSSRWQPGLVDAAQVERDHTTTLFFKAQVYGLKGDRMQSASFCAATLNRQLKQGTPGDLDVNEWVQNCLQLSGYFLDCNTFALSQHCCAAVEALLLQHHQRMQQQVQQEAFDSCSSGPQDKDAPSTQQQQQQQGTEPDPNKDQTDGKDQAGKQPTQRQQQQQQKGPAGKQPPHHHQQQLEAQDEGAAAAGGPSPALEAALSLLDADVAANVCLAFAKLQLYRLVASHEAVLEGKPVPSAFNSAAEVPPVLCFDALPGLPALASLAWGRGGLAHSHCEALALFRAGLPWFRRALAHYQLDGWVTEHCNILFEMSNLYRCLAGFEPDPHKRCVIHRSRTKLLQPLEGQLSPTHYPGLSRSISLELGNVFREIADIKAAAGREPDKVAAAMQSAAQHYRLFLDSFREESGQLPAKVEPEMEGHFLSGMFSMARMLQGLPGTGTLTAGRGPAAAAAAAAGPDKAREELATLDQAMALLGDLVKYVRHNSVADWQEQADMAEELSGLLQEKLNLVMRVHQL